MKRLAVAEAVLIGSCVLPACAGPTVIGANNLESNNRFTSIPAQDDANVTALMRAARDGETSDLGTLLKHGVDVNAKDKYGWTALTYASARGDAGSVKQLLKANADVNAKGEDGYTPLMVAVQYGHGSMVKLLLSNGADANAVTRDGKTAMDFASGPRRGKMAELLKKAGAHEPQTRPDPPTSFSDRFPATPPVLLNKPTPSYTQKARDAGVQGIVHMRVLVAADGTVQKARVLIGLPYGLSYQASEAALRLLFKPGTMAGQPVQMWKSVEVEFRLR